MRLATLMPGQHIQSLSFHLLTTYVLLKPLVGEEIVAMIKQAFAYGKSVASLSHAARKGRAHAVGVKCV